jgi:hypothetical protein
MGTMAVVVVAEMAAAETAAAAVTNSGVRAEFAAG